MTRTAFALVALLVAAPVAAAQTSDEPALNESEMSTDPPAEDESYLDDSADVQDTSSGDNATSSDGTEPTLAEDEMNTAPPAEDESYLDDEEDLAGTGAEDVDAETRTSTPRQGPIPGAGVVWAAVSVVLAGLAVGLVKDKRR